MPPALTRRRRLPSRRRILPVIPLLVLLAVAGLAPPVYAQPSRGAVPNSSATAVDDATRAANARAVAASLKLVNYYPRDRAWEQQWTRYSPEVTASDFARIRHLGGTSVRLIVFPYVFGYPHPSDAQRRNLDSAIGLADAAGLKVWLTLYDNFGRYTDLAGSRTWTTELLSPYAGDSRLLAIEIRNEIKIATTGAPAWAQDQIALIHQLVPTVPITVSLNGSVAPSLYGDLLAALRPQVPDLITYHYYGDPGLAYDHIKRAIAAVEGIPMVLGEAGLTTSPLDSRCPVRACREAEQVDWLQIVAAAAHQAGLAAPAPWILYDFTAAATERPLGAAGFGYGLYRADLTEKPSATVVSQAFAGRYATAPQNVDFYETTSQGTRARGWVPWRVTGTFRIQHRQGVDGAPALMVSGTDNLGNGASGWYARPLTAVEPGQRWQVQVFARGSGAIGDTTLSLVWLDGQGGWVGIKSASLKAGVDGWQTLAVSAVAPPTAGAARVYLRSGGNNGTVYFSHPTWTVTAP